jgi:hypothetical protein
MATLNVHQLYHFAYQAGLQGQESITCPKSYRGWVIPEMFEDGELAMGVWRTAYAEAQEWVAIHEHSEQEAAQDSQG